MQTPFHTPEDFNNYRLWLESNVVKTPHNLYLSRLDEEHLIASITLANDHLSLTVTDRFEATADILQLTRRQSCQQLESTQMAFGEAPIHLCQALTERFTEGQADGWMTVHQIVKVGAVQYPQVRMGSSPGC